MTTTLILVCYGGSLSCSSAFIARVFFIGKVVEALVKMYEEATVALVPVILKMVEIFG